MYTRSQQCAGGCIVLPKVVMNATPFVVHHMCMQLHDGIPLLMLVLLRIPFLLSAWQTPTHSSTPSLGISFSVQPALTLSPKEQG